MSGFSTPSTHEIGIYNGVKLDLDGRDATWRWIIKDHASVAEYSQRLGALVNQDRSQPPYSRRSRVSAGGGVTEAALRAIIGIIPGSPGESDHLRPVLTADETDDHGFAQLLELAIACWQYDCFIHKEFRDFAKKVQRKWKAHHSAEFSRGTSTLQHKNALDWMFISLVFEWNEIFPAMFVRAIIKYDPKGFPVQNNKQLPEDFRELVDEIRKQKTRKTYNYVRDAWISLYDPENLHGPSMNRILSHFKDPRLNIDLRKPAPENLQEQIDPDNLLREYEIVVGRNEGQAVELPVQQLPESDSAKLPPRRRGRGGAFSAITRMAIHSGLEAWKKVVKNGTSPRSLSSSQGSEHDEVRKETQSTMEADVNNWRTNNLAGIPLSNSRFSELRSKHIHQPVPEMDSNGRL